MNIWNDRGLKTLIKKILPSKIITLCRNICLDGMSFFKYIKNRGFIGDKRINRDSLIIEIEYGGLGDHLFYSHIPRLAKEHGLYKSVFLSNNSEVRNHAHKKIIWEENPYLDGFTNKRGRTIRGMEKEFLNDWNQLDGSNVNILDEIMIKYGVSDGKKDHEPEIYYQPKLIDKFIGATIFDPNFVTSLYDCKSSTEFIQGYLDKNKAIINFQFKPRGSCVGFDFPKHKTIEDESFEDFCNIIYSCEKIYCYSTGTAVLAAALGKCADVFYSDKVDRKFLFSKKHKYILLKH